MIYSNVEYLLLFLTTLSLYLLFPGSYRTRFVILTVASLFFYAWLSLVECVVFLFVVVFSWLFLWAATKDPKRKTAWLTVGVSVMALHLFFWKYAGWLTEILFHVAPVSMQGKILLFPLPAGISFFTLQGIAYLVDYGRGEAQMMRFDKYLLFKSFFPQLVAGPIVRAHEMKPQLERLPAPGNRDLWLGACLFCVGFMKKVLIADRIAPLVAPVFADPAAFDKWSVWLAPFAFTVQLWADFSGYTDMGRASARMLGLHLPENFHAPFLSQSGSEFWTRWHITLGTWIKDYIFKPLLRLQSRWQRGTVSNVATLALVSFITMMISGLWHGAALSFVAWGAFNGIWLACERFLRKYPLFMMPPFIRWAIFFALFVFSMIIFRADSMQTMTAHLSALVTAHGHHEIDGIDIVFASFVAMMLYHWATYFRTGQAPESSWLARQESRLALDSWTTQAAIACGVALLFCLSLYFRQGAEAGSFIYFKF